MLIYSGRVFIQVLEGASRDLDRLLEVIKQDYRHTNVTVIHDQPIERRRYPGWSMKLFETESRYDSQAVHSILSADEDRLFEFIGNLIGQSSD